MTPFPVQWPTAWSCNRPTAHACRSRRTPPTSRSETGWSVRAADRTMLAGWRSCRGRVCCPPHVVAAPRGSIGIRHAGSSILREEYRSVEIDDIAKLPEHEPRSHGQTGTDHIADHDLQPQTARFVRHRQTLGQTAALVELDVDHVEAAHETRQVGEAERAFIRGDRDP